MIRRAIHVMLLALLVCTGAGETAKAEAVPPRCALLGQMAVSSWLEMMGALSRQDDAAVDPVAVRLHSLSASYAALGCDMPVLGAAMDCLLTETREAGARKLAQLCMDRSGLTTVD